MNKKFSYTYNGKIISFFLSNGKEVMIDATEMALMYSSSPKDYDRLRPSKWLRSQEYKDYIDALIKNGQISSINDVIKQVPVQGKRGIRPLVKWTEAGKQFIMERALDWKLI